VIQSLKFTVEARGRLSLSPAQRSTCLPQAGNQDSLVPNYMYLLKVLAK